MWGIYLVCASVDAGRSGFVYLATCSYVRISGYCVVVHVCVCSTSDQRVCVCGV